MTEVELRKKFVDTAISYLGVKQGSIKHKEIVDTYNQIKPLPVGYKLKINDAWCAGFVSAMAQLCGIIDIFPAECSCPRMVTLAKSMGIWVENDAYTPKMGDLIMYDWQDTGIGDNTGSPDHVGIVVSVSSGKIKVIEGNKSKAVGYRELAVNGRYIRGFIVPKFSTKATTSGLTCQVQLNVLQQGATGSSVKALQILLNGLGYSTGPSGVDGSFGPATVSALKKYQTDHASECGTADGSCGKKTWTSLLS